MNTRREQVQAHRFMTRRIISAMLTGEPETNDLPMRRLGQALFASAMVGAIALAVVGVIAVLSGNPGELSGKTLVVEKETGAKFVYDPEGQGTNILYPVANYTSARLILGDPNVVQKTLPHSVLQGIPRGPELGIPNAPDALPGPKALLGLPFSVCDLPAVPGKDPVVVAVAGIATPGGRRLGDDDGLLVESDAGTFLIYHDHRLRVRSIPKVPLALSFTASALRVTDQFLNSLPAGPDLGDITIPGVTGTPVEGPGSPNKIGTVYRDENNQNYIMTSDGMVRIGATFALIRHVTHDTTIQEIRTAQAARYLADNPAPLEPPGYPQAVPRLINDSTGAPTILCAQYAEVNGTGKVSLLVFVGSAPAALAEATTKVAQSRQSIVLGVDQLIMPGGHAVLVRPTSSPGADNTGATVYLVTDSGVKYPLRRADGANSIDAVTALGYSGVTPLRLPLDMLDLLPTGVPLDPDAAREPIDTNTSN